MPGSLSYTGTMSEAPHVLVVDDDDRLRGLLRRYLIGADFLVTTAANAAEARARLRGLRFDVIVLDVMMPGEDGMGFTRWLREDDRTPVLMLTAQDSVDNRIAGLDSGADDYLVKPFEPGELLARLKAILRRVQAFPDVRFGAFVFDAHTGVLHEGEQPVPLTSSEEALLRALAKHPGEVLTREALGTGAGTRAIDVQITRLRRKIEPDPRRPRYLVTVRGEGYSLRTDDAGAREL
ncbi:MAG: response regulator transcription factor [Alphaproteobacteria bacterium]|nr:response regulator transcription factor [Alphaproteobacteria bacterium]